MCAHFSEVMLDNGMLQYYSRQIHKNIFHLFALWFIYSNFFLLFDTTVQSSFIRVNRFSFWRRTGNWAYFGLIKCVTHSHMRRNFAVHYSYVRNHVNPLCLSQINNRLPTKASVRSFAFASGITFVWITVGSRVVTAENNLPGGFWLQLLFHLKWHVRARQSHIPLCAASLYH